MTARRALALYLLGLHASLAAAAFAIGRGGLAGVLLAEAVLLLSAWAGRRLWRKVATPLARIDDAARLLEEGDFSSRLAEERNSPGAEEARFARAFNRTAAEIQEARVGLEARTHFFEKVLAASPGGVIVFGFDGEIVEVNPAAERLLERPVEAVRGRRAEELGSALGDAMAALASGGAQVALLAGGRRVKVQKAEFYDRGFARPFVLLEELTEELRQIEKGAFEKVIRLMSHEVNNSLGAARSLLESCLTYAPQLRPDDRQDFEQAVGVVVGRTRELGRFMEGIAEVVRVPPPRRYPTPLPELVDAVLTLMRAEAVRRGVELRWDRRDPVPPISLDRAQLEQVLVNVVKNALEAIGRDGRVTVALEAGKGRARLVVEDTGPGLSSSLQAKLFTPFFTTKDRGHGVGLAIVREILAQHGFPFGLEAPEGGPTRFWIDLPVDA